MFFRINRAGLDNVEIREWFLLFILFKLANEFHDNKQMLKYIKLYKILINLAFVSKIPLNFLSLKNILTDSFGLKTLMFCQN